MALSEWNSLFQSDVWGDLVTWWRQMCSSTVIWHILFTVDEESTVNMVSKCTTVWKGSTTIQRTCSRTLWFPRRIVDHTPLNWKWQEWPACCLIRSRTCTVCDTKGWTEFFIAGCRYGPTAWVKGQLMNKTRKRGWPHLSFPFFPLHIIRISLNWVNWGQWNTRSIKREKGGRPQFKFTQFICHLAYNREATWSPPSTFYISESSSSTAAVSFSNDCAHVGDLVRVFRLLLKNIWCIFHWNLDSFLSKSICSCPHICTTGSKNYVKIPACFKT